MHECKYIDKGLYNGKKKICILSCRHHACLPQCIAFVLIFLFVSFFCSHQCSFFTSILLSLAFLPIVETFSLSSFTIIIYTSKYKGQVISIVVIIKNNTINC